MFMDLKEIITNSSKETFDLGKDFAKDLKGGEILCFSGDLGAGKTTFTQGLLAGLGVSEKVNSPTFVIIKEYQLDKKEIKNIYHIDTYRVEKDDIIDLGWDDMIKKEENITIIEWPEKINEIIPQKSIWIKFEHLSEDKRKIIFNYENK